MDVTEESARDSNVMNLIKAQSINNRRVFDKDGNGNIGFEIFNIQRNGNSYKYVKVSIQCYQLKAFGFSSLIDIGNIFIF